MASMSFYLFPADLEPMTSHKRQHVDLERIAWATMKKYGFEPDYPPAVLQEVSKMQDYLTITEEPGRRDLRMLLWSSIDNYDSRDLDQLQYCETISGNDILVRIAIADVDAYVYKQSPTDRHAAHNGTSIYTGVHTFPMLPVRLSEGITSLLPGEDRMAVVYEYTVHPDGTTRPGDIYQAYVQNKAKLVYEEVGDWLEETGEMPDLVQKNPELAEQVLLQNEAAHRLKKNRLKGGALVLETIEAQALMEKGRVLDLVTQRQNMARCLIEEFMVAANRTVVHFLGTAELPMIQRIVRIPKNWEGIVATAARYGEKLPKEPDALALTSFLAKRRDADPERFPDLSLTVVKLMGAGEYVALFPGKTPIGHFALAVRDYTHGTAPNRRYVDIVIQRLIKTALSGKKNPYKRNELAETAEWLSDCEKRSKKVERFMTKAAAAVLLERRIGETFEALVTGASPKGTYVRLLAPPVEGRVMQGEHGLSVGDKVMVRLLLTDPHKGYIDFACTGRR